MREIVLDTETTGFDPYAGDRMIEMGCVVLENHVPTGETYHRFYNPERDVPEEVVKVHGITYEMLKDKPKFAELADEFLQFVGDSPLVIHNAAFDMKFINAELAWAKKDAIPFERSVDTLAIARKLFPGAHVKLDDLCRRFNIDNSRRTKHGALLDAELLAEVYLELLGGREPGLILGDIHKNVPVFFAGKSEKKDSRTTVREPRDFPIPAHDAENHEAFMKKIPNAIWND